MTIKNDVFPVSLPRGVTTEKLLKEIHSAEGRFAELITSFAGSMNFVYFHAIWFSMWIILNEGFLKPFIFPFDPFPYGLLTMVVSLEAIFLSTFIMITQNRQALIETYRELEEDKEEAEAEEEVEDIQKDLDDIKRAILLIQKKVIHVEKVKGPDQTPTTTS
jgi:uncharacterized membrane protein